MWTFKIISFAKFKEIHVKTRVFPLAYIIMASSELSTDCVIATNHFLDTEISYKKTTAKIYLFWSFPKWHTSFKWTPHVNTTFSYKFISELI